MKKLIYIFFVGLGLSPLAFSAGFHETAFDLSTSGTAFIGVSPIYSSTTYNNSKYSLLGYQGTLGYDYSFSETFGMRVNAAYAHVSGDNLLNMVSSVETSTSNDLEFGLSGTFKGFSVGGGVISRSAEIDYKDNAGELTKDLSGLLKFARASLDFEAKESNIGFSLSQSYIFGDLKNPSVYSVSEWRTLFNVCLLLKLK